MLPLWLAIPGAIIWTLILLLPWRPWSTRETLDGDADISADLDTITVLIPARNEAQTIARTLAALARQGNGLKIIVVDDQSTDATAAVAAGSGLENLTVLAGQPLADGWTGKLWALHQGLQLAGTDKLLLLDADIELQPGILPVLQDKMHTDDLQLVSLMARLRMENRWEKLLMPAFIYFFKLLYPFQLSNGKSNLVAAAAGGCILLQRSALEDSGGFIAIRDAIIDDCSLARSFKQAGYRTWIGLTHSALSLRRYGNLATVWDMVARTAYSQLRYSPVLLLLCTLLLTCAFLLPVLALLSFMAVPAGLAIIAFFIMVFSYLPVIHYYGLAPLWALTLPLAALLYLLMTWSSALRHRRGISARWKERDYSTQH